MLLLLIDWDTIPNETNDYSLWDINPNEADEYDCLIYVGY